MTRLPDFRLETYFSRWEFTARHHLTASDVQTMTLGELLTLADDQDHAAFENLSLGYTETYGDPALREAIAGTYERADAADVICFAGAEEALYLAMNVLLGAGDHAVVVTPNYQAAETVPLALCEVTGVALDPDQDWALDLDVVKAAIRPNTRVVSVNFPNNPTGKVISLADFTELARAPARLPRTSPAPAWGVQPRRCAAAERRARARWTWESTGRRCSGAQPRPGPPEPPPHSTCTPV
ncbi:aminotransferase class I/II-fold pyridoxal phosphate-dependent enzyme [Nonomuraea sp. B19D2]|uniref:aminotransferase class I/II-fold pyridoxal phosphate-dependent enzyme n=1 Tax=Nonomuraea sp. B19D2 TaxID=3159561 RepID=UPI0032DBE9EF